MWLPSAASIATGARAEGPHQSGDTVRYGWSLDRAQWTDATTAISATASKWRRVARLNPTFARMVPGGPGVYLMCVRPESVFGAFVTQMYNVVYVGQAINL